MQCSGPRIRPRIHIARQINCVVQNGKENGAKCPVEENGDRGEA